MKSGVKGFCLPERFKMGIDFSGVDARWSYSGFMTFRERVAAGAGIELMEMDGFGGQVQWEDIEDPIKILLNKWRPHSPAFRHGV